MKGSKDYKSLRYVPQLCFSNGIHKFCKSLAEAVNKTTKFSLPTSEPMLFSTLTKKGHPNASKTRKQQPNQFITNDKSHLHYRPHSKPRQGPQSHSPHPHAPPSSSDAQTVTPDHPPLTLPSLQVQAHCSTADAPTHRSQAHQSHLWPAS